MPAEHAREAQNPAPQISMLLMALTFGDQGGPFEPRKFRKLIVDATSATLKSGVEGGTSYVCIASPLALASGLLSLQFTCETYSVN